MVTYQKGPWSKPKVISQRYEEDDWEYLRESGNKGWYRVYLRTEHWKTIRMMRLMEDNYICAHCGRSKPDVRLEVHHKSYDRIGDELLDDLQTLCSECHSRVHGKERA